MCKHAMDHNRTYEKNSLQVAVMDTVDVVTNGSPGDARKMLRSRDRMRGWRVRTAGCHIRLRGAAPCMIRAGKGGGELL